MARKAKARTSSPKGRKSAPKKIKPQALREDRFVQEYVIDLRGKDAAIRAGYSPDSARFTASELLAKPSVQAKLAKAMAARAVRTSITADRVLEKVWAIADADPRELVELRRTCCRYCYGKGHRYQRTPRELEERRADWDSVVESKAEKLGIPIDQMRDEFDDQGGIGWDPRRDPHPECPECHGEGEPQVFTKDQRDLSIGARMLYAGTKTTEKGIEIKMHSQADMLIKAGMHVGLFKPTVEHTGKNGKPIEHSSPGLEAVLAQVGASEMLVGPAKSRA